MMQRNKNEKALYAVDDVIVLQQSFFMPVISHAVPGNGNGNGNRYGWGNRDGPARGSVTRGPLGAPEPSIFLLGSGMVGLAGWIAEVRRKLGR
jgi:hypothetical protein